MNPNIPEKCNGCGKPLLLENLYVDDGCPCNTPRGVNFKPAKCDICDIDVCVKPGHRLAALFGIDMLEGRCCNEGHVGFGRPYLECPHPGCVVRGVLEA